MSALKRHYLALQQSSPVHRDIVLTLHTFNGKHTALRHSPDLQDSWDTQSQRRELKYRTKNITSLGHGREQ